MRRSSLLLAAAAATLAIGTGSVQAQAPSTMQLPAALQPGQRLALGTMMGQSQVRMIMIGQDGNTVILMYDAPQGSPQSQRVLRLENRNGMLEVVYDTSVASMNLGTAGAARIVPAGNNMYSVEYGPAR